MLKMTVLRGVCLALLAGVALRTMPAAAQGQVTMYCSILEEQCREGAAMFEKASGIKVLMVRKSTGESYATIKAEAANPKGDVWWGGTGDPHLQAAEEDLTEPYVSPMRDQLHPWAIAQAESAGDKTIGIYSGALGFGYNSDMLAKAGLAAPACWEDLTKPEYKGMVQMANPNSSGTAYTFVATMVQLMGEDKGYAYMKALHKNISQYTKSGIAPINALKLGETAVGIAFLHDIITQKLGGAPVKAIAPCEGTGYEVGSMSIIKGAKNMDNAKKWYDWALTPEAQKLAIAAKSYQVPSNKNSLVPPESPKLDQIKLIDYDFAKYGAAAERKRLLSRWDNEVKNLPR